MLPTVLKSLTEVVAFFFSVLRVFCRRRRAGYGRCGDLSGGTTIGKSVGSKKLCSLELTPQLPDAK